MRVVAVVFIAMLIAPPPVITGGIRLTALAQAAEAADGASEDAVSPEEKMRRRFPQPVRVGDLIGLRVLDDDDVTIGFVRQVVRTPKRKVLLIVAYGGWFGWGARPVAVPIELVAIFGRQLAALDMPPSDFATAPTWSGTDAEPVPSDEMIPIALTKR